MFCVHELTVYCCFIFCCCCCFSFLLPRSLLFLLQGKSTKKVLLHHMQQAGALEDFFTTMKFFWTACEAFYTAVRVDPQAAGFSEVGDLTSSWHKTSNCCRTTVAFLDAKGLWKPAQSFVLAGFTLSLPCSASCGTEQTTIDIGCDPALPRNCVDHPADCNLFRKLTLLNSQ